MVGTPQPPADRIAAARDAVGEHAGDDYVIAPTQHAAALSGAAPQLADVLRGSGPETDAAEYERLDADAIGAQHDFKRTAARANGAILLTTWLGAAVLAASTLDGLLGSEVSRVVAVACGAAGVVAGALGAMWLQRLKRGELFNRWMRARARAEAQRVRYFERVVSAPDPGGGSPPLPLLQLEYVRRYLLDVELAFYRRRGADHRRGADRSLRLEGIALVLATVGTGIGALLVAAAGAELAAASALGIAGAALAGFAQSREAVTQDARNAERYERTREALVAVRERLDAVRAAAAVGDADPVRHFFESVVEQVSVEHRQWLDAAEQARGAIGRLEEALERSRAATAPNS